MALKEVACKNARCPDDKSRVRLADANGLYREVTPAAGRYWRWKYRFAGKEKRLALGVDPVAPVSKARQKRDEARRLLSDGVDPGSAKADAQEGLKLRASTEVPSTSPSVPCRPAARSWATPWRMACWSAIPPPT